MLRSLRIGFATNSSSTHSIVFHKPGDPQVSMRLDATPAECADDNFVFSTARDKALYILSSDLFGSASAHNRMRLKQFLDARGLKDIWADLADLHLGIECDASGDYMAFREGGVDLLTWMEFMLSDEITIYGYHDGDGDPAFELSNTGVTIDVHNDLKWKQDGKALVGYSPRKGTKLRWSPEPYEKSLTPELVDLKITDYCGHDCKFCYQGSSKQGQHAPLERIKEILDACASMQVFEIALGGGEPASHPQFRDILEYGFSRGLTMNFTAYGIDWSRDRALLDMLHRNWACGIGISVHKTSDLGKIDRVRENFNKGKIFGPTLTAQTVVGALPFVELERLAEDCIARSRPLLLLGYKTTGRGASFKPSLPDKEQMRELLKTVRDRCEEDGENLGDERYGFSLGVDTAFLDQYGDVLDELGVPHMLRTSPEGKFSMYVDAVTGTCGPSSYCPAEQMAPIEDLKAQFAAW